MAFSRYRAVLANPAYRRFWLGFTFSAFGDAITRVALTWFVYEQTRSPEALGWLMACYTGPVVGGGLLAGWLLDRFDRRQVMAVDNALRGLAMLLIPLLNATGHLALWHLYAAAAIYGFLMMISLAGGPALIPALVARDQLQAANALEMLSFTIGGVAGPVAAAALITTIGALNAVLIDALSYFLFAWALLAARPAADERPEAGTGAAAQQGFGPALKLLLTNPVLLSTTAMYLILNIGGGAVSVWLPILANTQLAPQWRAAAGTASGAEVYSFLLSAWALGEVVSVVTAGERAFRLPLGTLICLAQGLSGAAVALVLAGPTLIMAVAALTLFGAATAPLTIWAQTLRMEIIPEPLRGRTFALLRLLMQSGGPLGGLAAGWLLPSLGLPAMVALSALGGGLPGLLGFRVKALRAAGGPAPLVPGADPSPAEAAPSAEA